MVDAHEKALILHVMLVIRRRQYLQANQPCRQEFPVAYIKHFFIGNRCVTNGSNWKQQYLRLS